MSGKSFPVLNLHFVFHRDANLTSRVGFNLLESNQYEILVFQFQSILGKQASVFSSSSPLSSYIEEEKNS